MYSSNSKTVLCCQALINSHLQDGFMAGNPTRQRRHEKTFWSKKACIPCVPNNRQLKLWKIYNNMFNVYRHNQNTLPRSCREYNRSPWGSFNFMIVICIQNDFRHFAMISPAAWDKGCPRALFDQLRGNGNGTSPTGRCNFSNAWRLKYFVSSRPITLSNTVYPTHVACIAYGISHIIHTCTRANLFSNNKNRTVTAYIFFTFD